ncbi:LysR family transcriptional regulator [Microbacterium panaciterrae]|uniref:LysR substrate-binding domain-containing protein n=1 Tax=Microbacterium panaciterrae TaxID=985759 RepID=A0ABP8P6S0_9MICO
MTAFLTVVRHRHFGHAAAELGVSISAVTKRVQRLEAELGIPLIERDSGGVIGLTPAGRRFLQFAPRVLEAAQAAQLAAVAEPATRLRVAVPAGVDAVAPLMPAALATLELALSHAYPGVGVVLAPTLFERLDPDLVSGAVDAVLTFGVSDVTGVTSTRLGELRRVGLVPTGHPYTYRRSVPVAEFARQPLLYTPELPPSYMDPFVLADVRPLAEAVLVRLPASRTSDVAGQLLTGPGITVIPAALAAALPSALKRVELDGVPACWYYMHHRSADARPELLAMVALFADFTETITRAAHSERH